MNNAELPSIVPASRIMRSCQSGRRNLNAVVQATDCTFYIFVHTSPQRGLTIYRLANIICRYWAITDILVWAYGSPICVDIKMFFSLEKMLGLVIDTGISLVVWAFQKGCCVFALCSGVHQHLPAAFRLRFRAQHSRTTGVARPRDFAVTTASSATTASENLWSADFRPGSAHNDSLFIKFGEIWSGFKTRSVLFWS